MRTKTTHWTKAMDKLLAEIWLKQSVPEISATMGLSTSVVQYRGEKLLLPKRNKGLRYEPEDAIWIAEARKQALVEGIPVTTVLSGDRCVHAVVARRKAIAAVLRNHPHVSIGGLSRISGLNRDTVSAAAKRMGALVSRAHKLHLVQAAE